MEGAKALGPTLRRQKSLARELRCLFDSVANEPIPAEMLRLVGALDDIPAVNARLSGRKEPQSERPSHFDPIGRN